jgi:hypothetical protein
MGAEYHAAHINDVMEYLDIKSHYGDEFIAVCIQALPGCAVPQIW